MTIMHKNQHRNFLTRKGKKVKVKTEYVELNLGVDELIDAVGKIKGSFKNKSHRAAKLIDRWDALESKFESMIERGRGWTKQARLAYATLLMMETGIRTGNESSAEGWVCENQIVCRKANKEKKLKVGDVIWRHPMYGKHVATYGLTTLQNGHVIKKGKKKIQIAFVGKKLVDQHFIISNPTLVEWMDTVRSDDSFLGIKYHELKNFVKKYVGRGFTPKDIRMAKVNMIFIDLFGGTPAREAFEEASTKTARRKVLMDTIAETAEKIGHTKSVCKSAYLSSDLLHHINTAGDIHPQRRK